MQRLRMFAANVLNLAGLCLIGAFVLTAQRGNSPMYTAALVGDSDDADCACALIAKNKSIERALTAIGECQVWLSPSFR